MLQLPLPRQLKLLLRDKLVSVPEKVYVEPVGFLSPSISVLFLGFRNPLKDLVKVVVKRIYNPTGSMHKADHKLASFADRVGL